MAIKIGTEDGITCSEDEFKRLDPKHKDCFTKLGQTLHTMKNGHNEYQDRIAALEHVNAQLVQQVTQVEEDFKNLPFAVASS